ATAVAQPPPPSAAKAAAALSAELLRAAYALPPNEAGARQLTAFLDLASALKAVEPEALSPASDEALCFWTNIYHTLVRHAALVLGPAVPAKEWGAGYAGLCYEVGAEVFSAAEVEACVLRGRLSRPAARALPKHLPPPPPEGYEHYRFALTRADARINFVLNCGSQSCPPSVYLLTPSWVEEQINRACGDFCAHTIKVDPKRKHIFFHKVCDTYAADFGQRGDPVDALRYSLRFADERLLAEISPLLDGVGAGNIKHHALSPKCRADLRLVCPPEG
ncbi:unnamed protein product, partial [Phaeothamnion confervicola]